MKLKMTQVIKENHLPPHLHNEANTACCSPTLTVNRVGFLLNKRDGMPTKATHCLCCKAHYKGKDGGPLGFLLLTFYNF